MGGLRPEWRSCGWTYGPRWGGLEGNWVDRFNHCRWLKVSFCGRCEGDFGSSTQSSSPPSFRSGCFFPWWNRSTGSAWWESDSLNAVAIPLLALILALGLPCSFLAITWPAGAEPLAELLASLLSLLAGLTEISGLPGWMAYRVPSPPMWVALGFGISWVAVGLAICLRRGVAFAGPVAAGFALLIAVSPFRADLALTCPQ